MDEVTIDGPPATGTVPHGGVAWLQFVVETEKKCQVRTTTSRGLALVMTVFGPDDQAIQLGGSFSSSWGYKEPLAPGTYFIKIRAKVPTAAPAYSVTVSAVSKAATT